MNKEIDYDGKLVVVTHHSPLDPVSCLRGDPVYGKCVSLIDYAYHACLEEYICEYDINLWCFGHIHDTIDAVKFGTRVVTNCVGYFNEPTNFNNNIIEI